MATPHSITTPRALARARQATDETSALRRAMERAVERLLNALDALDGDVDLEPALGSPEVGSVYNRRLAGTLDQRRWSIGDPEAAAAEREDVSEDEGAACEDEGGQDDREPDGPASCLHYASDGAGGDDQRRLLSISLTSAL
jgi:hypothetical protein